MLGVTCQVLFPKCLPLQGLYGWTKSGSLEWSDGLLTSALRRSQNLVVEAVQAVRHAVRTRPKPNVGFGVIISRSRKEKETRSDSPVVKDDAELDEQTKRTRAQAVRTDEAEAPYGWHWLVLDGPVDTFWVENLNTLLDDTRTLSLANGERVKLAEGMRLLFEVDSLREASPATVSRCGMVYMVGEMFGLRCVAVHVFMPAW